LKSDNWHWIFQTSFYWRHGGFATARPTPLNWVPANWGIGHWIEKLTNIFRWIFHFIIYNAQIIWLIGGLNIHENLCNCAPLNWVPANWGIELKNWQIFFDEFLTFIIYNAHIIWLIGGLNVHENLCNCAPLNWVPANWGIGHWIELTNIFWCIFNFII